MTNCRFCFAQTKGEGNFHTSCKNQDYPFIHIKNVHLRAARILGDSFRDSANIVIFYIMNKREFNI